MSAARPPHPRLTLAAAEERAREIWRLRAEGNKHEAIAAELGLKRATVTYYLGPKARAAHRIGHFGDPRSARQPAFSVAAALHRSGAA